MKPTKARRVENIEWGDETNLDLDIQIARRVIILGNKVDELVDVINSMREEKK